MSIEVIVSRTKPICLVGGAPIAPGLVSELVNDVDCFVGVDSGADHLLAAGITPAAVIGDLDSVSKAALSAFADVVVHDPSTDTTDFEKTLPRVDAPAVIAIGFTGGRLDHVLSVLSVMRRSADKPVVLLDADDASFLAPVGQTSVDLPKGTRVSVMPLTPATVTLSGVVWPFTHQLMQMDGFTSPSNAALGGRVDLQTDAPVLVTLPRACLPAVVTAVVRE